MTPIQLQYQTAGSPGPGVAVKRGTHWPEAQTEATALGVGLGRERGGGRPCCAVLGLARQPDVLCAACPGRRDPETRWPQVAGLDQFHRRVLQLTQGLSQHLVSSLPRQRRSPGGRLAAGEVGTAPPGAGGSHRHCHPGQQGLLTGLSPNWSPPGAPCRGRQGLWHWEGVPGLGSRVSMLRTATAAEG